jgi:hypothetical protein
MQVTHGTTRNLQGNEFIDNNHCSYPITRNILAHQVRTSCIQETQHTVQSEPSRTGTYQTSRPYTIQQPALLPGPRCYTTSRQPKRAGLGVFIINTEMHPPHNIYIKGVLSDSSSVPMAEAAAVISQLQLQDTNFL